MRPIKNAKLTVITLSAISEMEKLGFKPLHGGDASRANSDYLMVMEQCTDKKERRIEIVCPSFLRGPLGFTVTGAVSY